MDVSQARDFPLIQSSGIDGMLVSFGARLEEAANRAALAFRDAVARADWSGLEEVTASLVSVLVRFDPDAAGYEMWRERLRGLLAERDWYGAALPEGRRLWRIPAVFGTALAPQLEEAADMAGLSPDAAIAALTGTRLRIQTIGFAPGQPYLGELPPAWDIPRQTQLTGEVPVGAVAVAIRQLVMFSVPSPTGWRHVAQSPFRPFRPESAEPFVLRPGDEVYYEAIAPDQYDALCRDPKGGARSEPIR